jgi:hypothetical protein
LHSGVYEVSISTRFLVSKTTESRLYEVRNEAI